MFALIIYLISIFVLMLFLLFMIVYTLSLIYASLMGSPYVPTKQKEVEFIIGEANLKPKSIFLELGCGDGRMVRTAVKRKQVIGRGVDINPLIIIWARLLGKIHHMESVTYKVENIFDTDLRKADYIFIFLLPDLIRKLTPKFEKKIKKNTVIISHGFPIIPWKKFLYKTIPHSPFPTYFYRFRTNNNLG